MGTCDFCKINAELELKSCVCKKVSYCSKECQAKDWKSHKPSCPPFTIRESPGKGRGLFATRRIKEGQVILEEYPLLVLREGMSISEFRSDYFPSIDEETKSKIFKLNDPADDIKILDTETVVKLVRKNPIVKFWWAARTDEISKIFRIFSGNNTNLENDEGEGEEAGLYINYSLLNHSCVPNTILSWVMGDFRRHQLRAMMVIEKDEEILVGYRNSEDFIYGSRELRRQELLGAYGFLCACSECSMEEEDLEESDRMRAEIMEKIDEVGELLTCEGHLPKSMRIRKKAMKLAQRRVKLIQKLNIRSGIVNEMINFYALAVDARNVGISTENDPDIFLQEAWKYAVMFGDLYIDLYFKYLQLKCGTRF